MSGLGVKSNKDNDIEARSALYRLRDMVQSTDCALVGIGHLNKKVDLSAFDRFGGSGSYVQVARSFIGVQVEDETNPRGPRRFSHIGGNLGDIGDDLLLTPKHIGKPGRTPINTKDPYVAVNWEKVVSQTWRPAKPSTDERGMKAS